ncbi:MAG: hypothetical protein ACLP7P_20335 [Rhodomicrobium sp.]
MTNAPKPSVEGLDIEPTFANVFNVTLNPLTTRIALGEFVVGNVKEDSRYRHAFVMPTPDAIELAKLILALAEQNEQQKASSQPPTMQ